MNKLIIQKSIRATVLLIIAGVFIGVFHQYDLPVAILLLAFLVYKFIQEININPNKYKTRVLFIGVLSQMLIGVAFELWGIRNGHWIYHDLSSGREFPLWLPVAWAFTFLYFYRYERTIFSNIPNLTVSRKLLIVALIYAFYPTFGEMITINLGVWTYAWGYQLFGVPLLAIFLLMFMHSSFFLFFRFILKKYRIYDPVFNEKQD